MEWTDHYETGHPVIDRDHRDIVDIINRLEVELDTENPTEISGILCDLTDSILDHFGREERMMLKIRYPEYGAHMLSHCRFFAALTRFIYVFETDQATSCRAMHAFLTDWMVGQECSEDQPFVRFLNAGYPDDTGR
ncbi:MAG: bacteriohemerythrin [Rhodospirillaceae bacterium]